MNSRSSQIKEAIKRRSRVIGFTLLGCCIALAVWAGAAVIWQPDNNYPQPNDPTARSLQKINSILKVWEVAGYPVGATVNTKTNMVLRSNTNDVYAEVEDGQVWVKVKAGSVTTSFPSGSTNNTGALNLAPTNVINVNVTNLASGTSDANAVVVKPISGTNALLGWTGAAWVPVLVDANGNLMIGNTFNPSVTNDAATGLYVRQSTNQVSFSTSSYSLGNNGTAAGVVTNLAWASTNSAFHATSGSGLCTSAVITSSTNRDYNLWFFPGKFDPGTVGNPFLPTRAQMQGMKGPYATTNAIYCSEWQICGTNFVKRVNLGCAMQNTDSSQHIVVVATHLDTKADVAANAIQVEVGMLNDK